MGLCGIAQCIIGSTTISGRAFRVVEGVTAGYHDFDSGREEVV